MALPWCDLAAENRPGFVPTATASGYGGTLPDFTDPDERYNHPVINNLLTRKCGN